MINKLLCILFSFLPFGCVQMKKDLFSQNEVLVCDAEGNKRKKKLTEHQKNVLNEYIYANAVFFNISYVTYSTNWNSIRSEDVIVYLTPDMIMMFVLYNDNSSRQYIIKRTNNESEFLKVFKQLHEN